MNNTNVNVPISVTAIRHHFEVVNFILGKVELFLTTHRTARAELAED